MEDFLIAPKFGSLAFLDLLILVASIVLLLVIAFIAGRREKDTSDFFLGARHVPTAIACFSLVATEVSAVTITNVPGTSFSENLQYLQFYIGSAASKIFVAFLFLPKFYKHDCTSIYEFLRHRFGPPSQLSGSIFFFLTRLLASGARLFAACFAIAVIMHWTLAQALLVFTAVSIVFIAFGGIKAVVWTGAYQAGVFYLAGLAVIVYLLTQIEGGLAAVWQVAGQAGRLSVFDMALDWNRPTNFWAGTANAFFVGLAIFGADQEMVQRLLTVRTRRSSQNAILATIAAALPVTVIYLLIGTLMFVFFKQHGDAAAPASAKEIFPYYICNYLPVGLKGLIVAAILLASIDSPLSSLSSSFVMDIYKPLIHRRGGNRHYLIVSRCGVVGFGLVLAGVAWACQGTSNVLWLAFQIISITGGSMLGVFLLGILTRLGSNRGNVTAMILNSLAIVALMLASSYSPTEFHNLLLGAVPAGLREQFGWTMQLPPVGEEKIINLAWTWLIVIGTFLTFVLGAVLGWLLPDKKMEK